MVSQCFREGNILIKKYFGTDVPKYGDRCINHHWRMEKHALEKLKGERHIPTLIDVDEEKRHLQLRFVGHKITRENRPENWVEQCEEIEALQKKHNMFHLDVKPKNITVYYGIIYLIDWGLWTHDINRKESIKKVLSEL